MPKLFSTQNKKFLKQIDKPEKELNKFICENWVSLFPKLTLIASEFPLKGIVRSIGTSGRMDIVAYNPETKRFVIFELKKDYDRNITDQAADYREYVQENFSDIYLMATQKYDIPLPKYLEIKSDQVEIILIAKKFSLPQIERVKKVKESTITLIKYFWFENDLIFIDYINNDPDAEKIENINTKKVQQIGVIVNQDPDMFEIDRYFNLKQDAKEVFICFYQFLKTKGEVNLEPQQIVMKVKFKSESFSAFGSAGKGGSRKVLQINTNIDVSAIENVRFEDRIRPGQKKKGSLGTERYEVYFKDLDDMERFIEFLNSKI
jgi:hypothetical protein